MATLPATITADARKYWPQVFGGLYLPTNGATQPDPITGLTLWNPVINCFKVGEGGWVDQLGEIVPRVPDANLRRLVASANGVLMQDLDAVVDNDRQAQAQATRYASTSRFVFKKTLTIADFSWENPSTLRVRCLLDNNDCNDDGYGGEPELWELGLFSDHPVARDAQGNPELLMVAYCTFPKETKTSTKQLENVVRITF